MAKLYRLEYEFEGECRGIGLFQGMRFAGIGDDTLDELDLLFEDLPDSYLGEYGAVEFWFTEHGMRRFADAILTVEGAISEHNWSLICFSMDDVDGALYRDKYQVAFSRAYLLYNSIPKERCKSVDQVLRIA